MAIHDGHRERMRKQLKTSGMDSLSDVQVLEVLLYYAAPRGDTNPAAHALLTRFGTLDGVFSAPEAELKKVDGVGGAAAQLIALVPQVARRCLMSRSAQIQVLDTTSKCGQYLLPYFHGEHEEVVYLLCLDAKCKALDCVLIHRGGVNVASIAARKVVKAALDANATSVVLAHNHPSGPADHAGLKTGARSGRRRAGRPYHRRGRRFRLHARRRHSGGSLWTLSCTPNSDPPATSRRPSRH